MDRIRTNLTERLDEFAVTVPLR
ncbi:Hypothetical protein PFCIRM119_11850 [Propionibacterium freudenreichii]|uniref:Uncharacterized protein n=2 Tax=Propionibacterium freudenreichii TaxID=1744 RepID=D7GIU1_PROFC|nr:Hypothetical protein PFREUD_04790 [Propionibacterium freudenreichii subsp. shermanii CIRM-BIA1]CDP48037.1 Hypothetical protein PFCIRM129_08700 [Propionibacterium freudenreichii subsp. freudenreichii]CEG85440.1 Hypothetical protein PFCIRM118_09550 [Propionibacterium freudenreichii]CEG89651.1 Hypothetical protein PFCIRM119_11850 [Propionibacterium freudenreichii]CEG91266.1 Hypothetical protein PFCIRM121_09180 [Propionibacterium freudenreichii]